MLAFRTNSLEESPEEYAGIYCLLEALLRKVGMGISILRLMSGFFRFLISVSHVRKQFYAVQKGLHLSEKLHMKELPFQDSQMQLSNILFLFGGTGRIILTIVTVVNGISFVFSTMMIYY